MAHGFDLHESVVRDDGSGHCVVYEHREKPARSYHTYHNLAGYYAVAVFASDAHEDWKSWEALDYLHEDTGVMGDWTRFDRERMGASFRHARIEVLQILRERKHDVLELAGKLYRYGKIDYETKDW